MITINEAFPLSWPAGWRRTRADDRPRGRFGIEKPVYRNETVNGVTQRKHAYNSRESISTAEAIARILAELKAMGVPEENVVISTNLLTRNDGLPRSGARLQSDDPGAAVYWLVKREQRCMAIDQYDRVQDNLAAIAATLSAMRAIERHGGASILDRAFIGFAALAAPEQPWQVLGIAMDASIDEIIEAYRKAAAKNHPDRGGDSDQMARINRARDAMLEGAKA